MSGIVSSVFKPIKKLAKTSLGLPGDVLGLGRDVIDTGMETVGLKSGGGGGFGIAKGVAAAAPDLPPIAEPPAVMPVPTAETASGEAAKVTARRRASAEVKRRRGRASTILTALDGGDDGVLG